MASHEYQITVFSPEGKLHQIEYAFKAIKSSGLTSLAVRGKDCCIMVSQKKVSDLMMDPSTVTNLYPITPNIGCMVTGREADGRAWMMRLRQEAFEYLQDNGNQIPADVLAMKAADIAQLYTQKSGMRAYGVELTLCGYDLSKGPLLYKVDPAGHYIGYFACSSGLKEQEAQNELEKFHREKKGFADKEMAEMMKVAIVSLQNTLGLDFKSTDVEVGVVDKNKVFRMLSPREIENHLNVVQRFD
jgi:20S proteasome subunit alpha 1